MSREISKKLAEELIGDTMISKITKNNKTYEYDYKRITIYLDLTRLQDRRIMELINERAQSHGGKKSAAVTSILLDNLEDN